MTEERPAYATLDFTHQFLATLCARDFSLAERRAFVNALGLLDGNEKHPSLRVHELQGDLAGLWSASASDSLRVTFMRGRDGRRILLACQPALSQLSDLRSAPLRIRHGAAMSDG